MSKLLNALNSLKTGSEPFQSRQAANDWSEGLSLEQISAVKSSSRVICIQAPAGSGKTKVLQGFAKAAKAAKGVYLCYNQSIALEAGKKLPTNVECMTMHSFARRELSRISASWHARLGNIHEYTAEQLRTNSGETAYLLETALQTFNTFLISADEEPNLGHFTPGIFLDPADGAPMASQEVAVQIARKFWLQTCMQNSPLPLSHECYMKIWANWASPSKHNFILLDEAQDVNPSFLVGLNKQTGRIIAVGDSHQSIYHFRGAIDGMRNINDAEQRFLTSTYRFGQSICTMAENVIMEKGERTTVNPANPEQQTLIIKGRSQLGTKPLYLGRTNFSIIEKAIQETRNGRLISFSGGAKPAKWDLIHKTAINPNSAILNSACSSLEDSERVASKSGDQELAGALKICKKYKNNLKELVERINTSNSEWGDPEAVKLSTIHRSKGLEADWVELLDDIVAPDAAKGTTEHAQQINLIYVGITRAKKGLSTGDGTIATWLESKRGTAKEADDASLFE